MPTAKTATIPKKPRKPRIPKNAFALPERAADALPVPDFAPVPRQYHRHDGWTPGRQRAFIGALADTGCARRAARMVDMVHFFAAPCQPGRTYPFAFQYSSLDKIDLGDRVGDEV